MQWVPFFTRAALGYSKDLRPSEKKVNTAE